MYRIKCISTYENVSVTEEKKYSYLGRLFDFSEEGKCKVSMSGSIDRLMSDEEVEGTAVTPTVSELFVVSESSPVLDKRKRFY